MGLIKGDARSVDYSSYSRYLDQNVYAVYLHGPSGVLPRASTEAGTMHGRDLEYVRDPAAGVFVFVKGALRVPRTI